MYSATRLIDVAPGTDDATVDDLMARLRAAAADTGAVGTVVNRTLPGSANAGDVLAHFNYADRESWGQAKPTIDGILDEPIAVRVNGAEYQPGQSGAAAPRAAGTVYRALLLAVEPGTPEETLERFAADTLQMPGHIPTMLAWQLSRVDTARGDSNYTHVWEQEFTDINAVNGPYLFHPIHWAVVDAWFDPECTQCIIREAVCHSFCDLDGQILP
ncbi:Dabb family protein [Jongsikchunia kroppenstedtii]|uniref:Dabb family protein n=1 Tax=Jongsikchunia kroppenstedtii TaxID=1121721 RepID=UPI000374A163|nr:Dabb family protein [Jongsikchunia kroppenstedtii]